MMREQDVLQSGGERRIDDVDRPWQVLTEAGDGTEFAPAWLSILAKRAAAEQAVLALGPPDVGPFQVAQVAPSGSVADGNVTAAMDLVLAQRRSIVKSGFGDQGATRCAVVSPIISGGQLHGAVALRMRVTAELDLRQTMREIQWALPGLLLRLEAESEQRLAGLHERARTALSLLATTLEQPRFNVACNTAATELADRLGCDHVSLGFRRERRTRVVAISQSGNFSRKAELVQRVADCMDEAIDQRLPIVFPDQRDDLLVVTAAHEALAGLGRRRTIATVPMTLGDRVVGALTLERPEESAFDAGTMGLLEVVAGILGPVLEEKRLNDRALPVKALASAGAAAAAILGPRRLGLKLALLAAAAGLIALWQMETDFRLTADARIEGSVRRVVAAPLDGYVQSVGVRAGDLVAEGQTMATLDDREIALELKRWQTAKAQREREYQTALSDRNRSQFAIVATQIGQAEAEIALLEERLARTRLTAPFDGIVLSGNLDQSVGAPVTRGKVLFEIAPLDAYRVILSVDERDLAEVSAGLGGSLVLTALPGASYPIETGRVTSVASVEDGRNVFRVEAEMVGEPEELRPGMQGLAKIDVDRRPLAEVWTRNAVNWLRLALWRWMP